MTNPSEVVADLRIAAEDARRFSAALFDRGYVRREGVRPFSELLERAADTIDRLTSTGEAVAFATEAALEGLRNGEMQAVMPVRLADRYKRDVGPIYFLYASPREGHVEVPVEPTPEMLAAWYRYKNGHHFAGEPTPGDTSDYGAYRAMLAALPHNQGETKP